MTDNYFIEGNYIHFDNKLGLPVTISPVNPNKNIIINGGGGVTNTWTENGDTLAATSSGLSLTSSSGYDFQFTSGLSSFSNPTLDIVGSLTSTTKSFSGNLVIPIFTSVFSGSQTITSSLFTQGTPYVLNQSGAVTTSDIQGFIETSNTDNTKIVVPHGGAFTLYTSAVFDNETAGILGINVIVNGSGTTSYIANAVAEAGTALYTGGVVKNFNLCTQLILNPNDYIIVYLYNSNASSVNLTSLKLTMFMTSM